MNDWKIEHEKVIYLMLEYINSRSENYVLKGGTALMACYSLDRFSEDIDLDGVGNIINKLIVECCKTNNFTYKLTIDTPTTKRYMINYGNVGNPLKVEISYRKKQLNENEIQTINGIKVYNINSLAMMKAQAYTARDKIRDLYDITFIYNNYKDELTEQTLALITNALEYKGLEQFDYLISTQTDRLIDNEKLANDFLKLYEGLGLLYTDLEKNFLTSKDE